MKSLSRVRLFATPWIAAYQAPPSMGFSRQEYWSGVPLPSPMTNLVALKQHKFGFYSYIGEGNGNHSSILSCLENSMDRGAWQATVYGVARVGHA